MRRLNRSSCSGWPAGRANWKRSIRIPATRSPDRRKPSTPRLRGVRLAEGFERVAAEMGSISLVRSLVSKEGDHERGTYLVKTGYRPDPTVIHPSLGAICCHELSPGKTEIPRHISILPGQWPSRGGFLGDQYDAFKTFDPREKVPDIASRVAAAQCANDWTICKSSSKPSRPDGSATLPRRATKRRWPTPGG